MASDLRGHGCIVLVSVLLCACQGAELVAVDDCATLHVCKVALAHQVVGGELLEVIALAPLMAARCVLAPVDLVVSWVFGRFAAASRRGRLLVELSI